MVVKKDNDKKISVKKIFKYKEEKDNIINELLKYHKLNCDRDILEGISDKSFLIAKDIFIF